MSRISEGGLMFNFPTGWEISKYDVWAFYRRHFQKTADSKAVDHHPKVVERRNLHWSMEWQVGTGGKGAK